MSQEENKFVYEWDSLVIQLSSGENVHGSIRMMKQDIDNMKFLHGMGRGEILEMLVEALETTPNPKVEMQE
jgi:hypothetical protein